MSAAAIPFDVPIPVIEDHTSAVPQARSTRRRSAVRDRIIDDQLFQRERIDLAWRWRAACEHLQLGHQVMTPLGGIGRGGVPRVVHVEAAPTIWDSAYLIVELPPGTVI